MLGRDFLDNEPMNQRVRGGIVAVCRVAILYWLNPRRGMMGILDIAAAATRPTASLRGFL
jgi:hypothetical protein